MTIRQSGRLGSRDEVGSWKTNPIRESVRREASPRHVPDTIVQVPDIPYTITGKKMEIPVRKILMGAKPEAVASRDAVRDANALDWFARYAATAEVRERLGRVRCHHRLHAVLREEFHQQRGELAVVFDEQRLDHYSLGPPNPPCSWFWCISWNFCASV